MRTIRTRLGAAFVAVLLLGGLVAPAAADHDPEHDALQQDVTDAQAAYDTASAAYDAAYAQYLADLEAYQAAHATYLVELAVHEGAVDDVIDAYDCNENAQSAAAVQCRAERDAEIAALGAAPVGPEEPVEPSSAERDGLLEALNLAIAALEAYEGQEQGGEGDQGQQGPLGEPVESVDICHANDSAQNPYNAQNVSVDSIFRPNGHATHTGPAFDPEVHDQQNRGWGDIIPPFTYLDGDEVVQYPGSDNWVDGQALWSDDCGGGEGPGPVLEMDFAVTVSDEDICLGDEVTFTGTNDGDTDVVVTGTLTLPNETTMPLYYEVAAGGSFTLDDTPNQLGVHTVALTWSDDLGNTGSDTLTVDVQDCSEPEGDEPEDEPEVVEVAPVIEFDATSVCVADEQLLDYAASGSDWTEGTLLIAYGDGLSDELTLTPGDNGQLAWPLDGELPATAATVTFTVEVDGELEEVFSEDFALDEECGAKVEGIVEVDDGQPGRSGEAPVGPSDDTEVLGAVETLPETGASALALVVAGLLSLLSGGALLRRRPGLEG